MVQEALFINFVTYYLVHFFTNTFLNTKMGKARISGKLTLKVAPCSSSRFRHAPKNLQRTYRKRNWILTFKGAFWSRKSENNFSFVFFFFFWLLKLGRPTYFKVLISFSLFLLPALVKFRLCCFGVVPFPWQRIQNSLIFSFKCVMACQSLILKFNGTRVQSNGLNFHI